MPFIQCDGNPDCARDGIANARAMAVCENSSYPDSTKNADHPLALNIERVSSGGPPEDLRSFSLFLACSNSTEPPLTGKPATMAVPSLFIRQSTDTARLYEVLTQKAVPGQATGAGLYMRSMPFNFHWLRGWHQARFGR